MVSSSKLKRAIRRIVNHCLRVKPEENVVIITDENHLEEAVLLRTECAAITSKVNFFILEDLVQRPAKRVPFSIIKALRAADVSVLWVEKGGGEQVTFRSPLLRVIGDNARLRHAHMPGVDVKTIIEAFDQDQGAMQQLTDKVYQIMTHVSRVKVTNPAGSDFEVLFSPTYQWVAEDNVIEPGYWANLPAGAVYTHPASLSGVIVVDGVLGDVFSDIFGLLQKKDQLRIEIEESFITKASSANRKLLKLFKEAIASEKNANRVGEFSLGTNTNINKLSGEFLRDQKAPGVHIAFGDGQPEKTGCPYYCNYQLDAILRNATVIVDGQEIMKDGRYLI